MARWISAQPLWFVATRTAYRRWARQRLAQRHDSLTILGPHRVAWVDYTGSGVETIAHVRENGRGCIALPGEPACVDVVGRCPAHPSTRAVVIVDVERVSDSCGYGVPVMDLVEERDLLRLFADKKGPEGMDGYRALKNTTSIDGLPGL